MNNKTNNEIAASILKKPFSQYFLDARTHGMRWGNTDETRSAFIKCNDSMCMNLWTSLSV